MKVDLVLSSGFLAFGRHIGVLRAVQKAGLEVEALVGTSSGSVVGALWLAGMQPDAILAEIKAYRPLQLLRLTVTPWRGVASMRPFAEWLAQRLPPRIEDLPLPFAVGVVDHRARHQLLTQGPLAAAVAASCAMPRVFQAVDVAGQPFSDGGAADRLALDAWRSWRPGRDAVAHEVARTSGRDVPADLRGVRLVRTPRSGATFWNLGDVAGQARQAEDLAWQVLETAPAKP